MIFIRSCHITCCHQYLIVTDEGGKIERLPLGEGIGSLLILITLIYLAVQNRQQHKLLLSSASQARADSVSDANMQIATNPEYARLLVKYHSGGDLDDVEKTQFSYYFLNILVLGEHQKYQHRLGILPKELLPSIYAAIKPFLINLYIRNELWPASKGLFGPEMIETVDNMIIDIEQEDSAA